MPKPSLCLRLSLLLHMRLNNTTNELIFWTDFFYMHTPVVVLLVFFIRLLLFSLLLNLKHFHFSPCNRLTYTHTTAQKTTQIRLLRLRSDIFQTSIWEREEVRWANSRDIEKEDEQGKSWLHPNFCVLLQFSSPTTIKQRKNSIQEKKEQQKKDEKCTETSNEIHQAMMILRWKMVVCGGGEG